MAIWPRLTPRHAEEALPLGAIAPRRGVLKWLERLLLVIGVASLTYYAYVSVASYAYQAYEAKELDAILAGGPPTVPHGAVPTQGEVIGRIEIPRLKVKSIVRAGGDSRTLRLAVGYIRGTALPGEAGNVGLAGHRDTFFRRLREIQTDDLIRLVTPKGTFTYRVERVDVVEPGDVGVLDATRYPALTLVTCYPFTFVGAAPQRFIVRARLVPRLAEPRLSAAR